MCTASSFSHFAKIGDVTEDLVVAVAVFVAVVADAILADKGSDVLEVIDVTDGEGDIVASAGVGSCGALGEIFNCL